MHHQNGVSLTEILIGLLLSSLIVVGLVQQYLSVKKHYIHMNRILEDDFERQQVAEQIRNSIRRAGYTSCMNLDLLTTANRCHNDSKLEAVQLRTRTDGLKLTRMDEIIYPVTSFKGSSEVLIKGGHFSKGQKVIVADCFHAEVHQIASIIRSGNDSILFFARPMIFTYRLPTYLGRWIHEEYYINSKSGEPSLFYKLEQPEALSQVVKSMSVKLCGGVEHPLVTVSIGLKNEQQIQIKARVRS